MQLAAETQSGGGGYSLFLVMGLLFVVMYFFMIRPQQKRRKEIQTLQSGLGAGDTVVTVGGLYATVQSADEESVMLEIAPGVVARYARGAIARVTSSAAKTDDDEVTATDKVIDSD